MRTWPPSIQHYLHATYGEPLAREPLGGMSGGHVERVRFARTSVVVKAHTTMREQHFYRHIAPILARYGVATPELYWSANEQDTLWLVLEDLPYPLPRSRWTADREVLDVLCRLHHASTDTFPDLPDLFVSSWSDRLTVEALSCFPVAAAAELAPVLRTMQRASVDLFRPWCAISGDPNPTNWGVRANGTLVLFDWERFGRGTPALDLAITVPGLGERAAFNQVTSSYLEVWHQYGRSLPWAAEQLSRDVALAKLWSVVEFMSHYAAGNSGIPPTMIKRLIEQVPAWVGHLHRQMG